MCLMNFTKVSSRPAHHLRYCTIKLITRRDFISFSRRESVVS